jgi:nucleotide-binding universal stress UspA family protein
MNTPRPIVVGVNGSPSSLEALKWAVGQATLTGANVQAVFAWQYPALAGVDPITAHMNWRVSAEQTLDAALATALGPDRAKVSATVTEGHPAQVLLDASAHAGLLVIGNRGHGTFIESLPDSVRAHVLTRAACPVLVMSSRQSGADHHDERLDQ